MNILESLSNVRLAQSAFTSRRHSRLACTLARRRGAAQLVSSFRHCVQKNKGAVSGEVKSDMAVVPRSLPTSAGLPWHLLRAEVAESVSTVFMSALRSISRFSSASVLQFLPKFMTFITFRRLFNNKNMSSGIISYLCLHRSLVIISVGLYVLRRKRRRKKKSIIAAAIWLWTKMSWNYLSKWELCEWDKNSSKHQYPPLEASALDFAHRLRHAASLEYCWEENREWIAQAVVCWFDASQSLFLVCFFLLFSHFFFTCHNYVVPMGFLPMGKSGCFLRGKPAATESRYLIYGACWVFLCFHNPPNSDMDYRIFNVRPYANACDCTLGCTDTRKRVCPEGWPWEKNPLPHRRIEPASATCRSDSLPTELHPHTLFV